MSTQQRNREPEHRPEPAAQPAGDPADARARAARLLDAADDVIDRVLSTESASFLAQNRQQGGQ